MHIGTVRPEEARIFDSHEGYHQFHSDTIATALGCSATYGSFEIYFQWERETVDSEEYWWPEEAHLEREFAQCEFVPGWYWRPCFPGCLPDGDPVGPFATSRHAHQHADEWSPEYEDDWGID